MKKELLTLNYEYTDTFGGESNYSWVRRGTVTAKTERGLVRAAKKAVGLNGVRGRWRYNGEAFIPYGSCTILFFLPAY